MAKMRQKGPLYFICDDGPYEITEIKGNIAKISVGGISRHVYKLPSGQFTDYRLTPLSRLKYTYNRGWYTPDEAGEIKIRGYYPFFIASDGHAVFMFGDGKFHRTLHTEINKLIMEKYERRLGQRAKLRQTREFENSLNKKRYCLFCEKEFIAHTHRNVFCSSDCRSKTTKKIARDQEQMEDLGYVYNAIFFDPMNRVPLEGEDEIKNYALAFMDKFTARDVKLKYPRRVIRIVLQRMQTDLQLLHAGFDVRHNERKYRVAR
ncbi:hypothetical protein HMSP1_1 [Sinorhizobium phage HMSP1-Susan]|nr:hypothetical protein HMSP1_1 [Sinorhizobium phage HMSP1-Susan]